MSFTIEKILRVYDDSEGVYLEIRPNPDFPEHGLEIHTNNVKVNEEWYGKLSLCINSKEQALALSRALFEMSETLK